MEAIKLGLIIKAKDIKKVGRPSKLPIEDVLKHLILFHLSGTKSFKDYHRLYIGKIISYNRLIELRALYYDYIFTIAKILTAQNLARTNSYYYIDSTKLEICNNQRAKTSKLFKEYAEISKCSSGWFKGFKLHIITDSYRNIADFAFTKANIHDSQSISYLSKNISNATIYGDKGYIIGELDKEKLYKSRKIKIITPLKRNSKIKTAFVNFRDAFNLRNRTKRIESVFKNLKCDLHLKINHLRGFKSMLSFVLSSIIAYSL